METKEVKEVVLNVQKEIKTANDEFTKALQGMASNDSLKDVMTQVEEVKSEQKKLITRMAIEIKADKEEKSEGDKRIEGFLRGAGQQGFNHKYEKDSNGFIELKTISISDDTNAGYLVEPQLESMITTFVNEANPILDMVENISITSDRMKRVKNDTLPEDGGLDWGNEFGPNVEEQNLSLDMQFIPVHDVRTKAIITSNMLADAPNVESLVSEQVGARFSTGLAYQLINGDGVNKPKGLILNSDIPTIQSGAATGITLDQMLLMQGQIKQGYMNGAGWLMQRSTFYNEILLLQDSEARKYILPDVRANVAFQFMGAPIIFEPSMPVVAASSRSIVYGNFNQLYTRVTRSGMSILVDPYTQVPFVKYNFAARHGGDIRVPEAGVIMITGVV